MAYFWWEIAKILYFMGFNFENLYGCNTIGFTALSLTCYELYLPQPCTMP